MWSWNNGLSNLAREESVHSGVRIIAESFRCLTNSLSPFLPSYHNPDIFRYLLSFTRLCAFGRETILVSRGQNVKNQFSQWSHLTCCMLFPQNLWSASSIAIEFMSWQRAKDTIFHTLLNLGGRYFFRPLHLLPVKNCNGETWNRHLRTQEDGTGKLLGGWAPDNIPALGHLPKCFYEKEIDLCYFGLCCNSKYILANTDLQLIYPEVALHLFFFWWLLLFKSLCVVLYYLQLKTAKPRLNSGHTVCCLLS